MFSCKNTLHVKRKPRSFHDNSCPHNIKIHLDTGWHIGNIKIHSRPGKLDTEQNECHTLDCYLWKRDKEFTKNHCIITIISAYLYKNMVYRIIRLMNCINHMSVLNKLA